MNKAQNKPLERRSDAEADKDLFDDLETAIERGTKAWADVKDIGEWGDEQRGRTRK